MSTPRGIAYYIAFKQKDSACTTRAMYSPLWFCSHPKHNRFIIIARELSRQHHRKRHRVFRWLKSTRSIDLRVLQCVVSHTRSAQHFPNECALLRQECVFGDVFTGASIKNNTRSDEMTDAEHRSECDSPQIGKRLRRVFTSTGNYVSNRVYKVIAARWRSEKRI